MVAAAAPPVLGTPCPGTSPGTSAPSGPRLPLATARCWTPRRGLSSALQVQRVCEVGGAAGRPVVRELCQSWVPAQDPLAVGSRMPPARAGWQPLLALWQAWRVNLVAAGWSCLCLCAESVPGWSSCEWCLEPRGVLWAASPSKAGSTEWWLLGPGSFALGQWEGGDFHLLRLGRRCAVGAWRKAVS